jgi:parallel beta-helix repeat protein
MPPYVATRGRATTTPEGTSESVRARRTADAFEPRVSKRDRIDRRASRRSLQHSPSSSRVVRALVAVAITVTVVSVPRAFSAGVATLYVDANPSTCSDSGQGTPTQPYCTINAAAAKVAAGQTVQVAAGTYAESVVIPTSGSSSAPIVFTAVPGATVTLPNQVSGFVISGRSWITLNGFTVTSSSDWGINVSNSSNITISNNHASYAGLQISGKTRGGIRLGNVSDSVVIGNVADHNTYAGIMLTSGSTRDEVKGNFTFNNAQGFQRAAPGIRIYQSPNNTVDGNITHNNEDSGIEFYPGANNSLVYDNVSYNNGDHGIDDLLATGQRIISNTVYNNVTAGINLEGNSTGGTIANNVSVDNGIKSPRTHSDIRVEHGSTAGTTIDYDLVNLTTPDTLLIWDSVSYTSLSAFQSTTGQEAHGIQADPKWVNAASADFHLTAQSSAIDSANSGAGGQPLADVEGSPRVDDLAIANAGAGPRTYDDRGAYEFQPPSDLAPSAALTVSPSSGTAPLAVTADASGSRDTDATPIATYGFDFGDGSTVVGPQAGATATHTYSAAGTFTVKVTVTDTAGLSSTATAPVTVNGATVDAPPSAALTVSPSSGPAPLAVTADASGSRDTDATPIGSYRFDFGDGSSVVGPGATATHTYSAAGTFTVKVTVTDTAGLSATATATAQVSASANANLVRNPGFETDLSGWNTSGSDANVMLARIADGHTGGSAAQLVNTGTAPSTCTLNDSPNWVLTTSAGGYVASLWVRADNPGATLTVRFREYVGSTLARVTIAQFTLTTTWQQVSVAHTTASPGSSTLDFNAYVSKAQPGTAFYADDVTISAS